MQSQAKPTEDGPQPAPVGQFYRVNATSGSPEGSKETELSPLSEALLGCSLSTLLRWLHVNPYFLDSPSVLLFSWVLAEWKGQNSALSLNLSAFWFGFL